MRDVFVAEQSVAVEGNLGVENAQVAVGHDDQRVDFEKGHVLLDEGLVKRREKRLRIFSSSAVERESGGNLRHIVSRYTRFRVNGDCVDLLGRIMRNRFDIHAAFRRNDEGNAANRTVDQQRAVKFASNVGTVFDVETVDLLAGFARLRRHQRVAEHVLGVGDDFVDRLCKTKRHPWRQGRVP